jgi:hypothetical protein
VSTFKISLRRLSCVHSKCHLTWVRGRDYIELWVYKLEVWGGGMITRNTRTIRCNFHQDFFHMFMKVPWHLGWLDSSLLIKRNYYACDRAYPTDVRRAPWSMAMLHMDSINGACTTSYKDQIRFVVCVAELLIKFIVGASSTVFRSKKKKTDQYKSLNKGCMASYLLQCGQLIHE